jgi:hypothetical protein
MAATLGFGSEDTIPENRRCYVLLIETAKLLGEVLTCRSNRQGGGLLPRLGPEHNVILERDEQLDRTLQLMMSAATTDAAKYGISVHHHI